MKKRHFQRLLGLLLALCVVMLPVFAGYADEAEEAEPTAVPATAAPTKEPAPDPTKEPEPDPTAAPTEEPATEAPTEEPTAVMAMKQTYAPKPNMKEITLQSGLQMPQKILTHSGNL